MRGNTAAADWERRRADLDERRARIMADPVLRFYERHGRPTGRPVLAADDTAATATGDNEPGLA